MNSLELAKLAAQILDKKKADKIDVIKISDVTTLSDYFVIASASNTTHVRALADELDFELKKLGRSPQRIEGYQSANWIILDYLDVVVHVFYEETRHYYNLEKLWSDGVKMDVAELLKQTAE